MIGVVYAKRSGRLLTISPTLCYCKRPLVYGFLFFFFYISWAMPYLMEDLLTCWRGGFKGHQSMGVLDHNSRSLKGLNSCCFN